MVPMDRDRTALVLPRHDRVLEGTLDDLLTLPVDGVGGGDGRELAGLAWAFRRLPRAALAAAIRAARFTCSSRRTLSQFIRANASP